MATNDGVHGAAPFAPPAARSRVRVASVLRPIGAVVVALAGLVAVGALFEPTWWTWLLWLGVGVLGGMVAGRLALAPAGILAVAGWYLVAPGLGLATDDGPWWLAGAAIMSGVVVAGFALGSMLGIRHDRVAEARTGWSRLGRPARLLVVAPIAVFLVAQTGLAVAAATIGSQEFVRSSSTYDDCRTPTDVYGWSYEAVNYDLADDVNLGRVEKVVDGTPTWSCTDHRRATAGDEVIGPDGVRLAGWYIPAASGIGPTGPTVVIVPGWKSNKTDALKYAWPFHDDYNLLLTDLRNQGRSDAADTTMGTREALDVIAFLDWLEVEKAPSHVIGVGNSMGAATLAVTAAQDERLEALILDSVHADIATSAGNIVETEHGLPSDPSGLAIAVATSLRLGFDVRENDPVRLLPALGTRPLLLVYGTGDVIDTMEEAAARNFEAAWRAGVPVQLATCPGARHGRVIDACPEEWARWARSFVASVVGG